MNTKQMTAPTNNRVSMIPATRRAVQAGGQIKTWQGLRVAAYCRVSTGDESQQTSYTKQCEYYTELIRKKPEWTMAGIYADEAITGTSRAKRKQFNNMMLDAQYGRIDYIVTKSISRFARNTVDTLNCVRQLRNQNPPVGIYFEKENIDTLDAKGELILTILSAMAQDESRSISDNIRWTFQKNFREGKPHINLKRMLGYDAGPNGEWVINPEQAEIVRTIFERYLCGCAASHVAEILNKAGKRTINGNLWRADTVLNVLRNEKYVGDLEMQKTITKDFLTHESVPNKGEAPKYYVTDHHVGIIDRVTWDRTQVMLMSRGKRSESRPQKEMPTGHPLSNMLCGSCGGQYRRVTYTNQIAGYNDERSLTSRGLPNEGFKEFYTYGYAVWRCEEKYKGHEKSGRLSDAEREQFEKQCPSRVIHEVAVEQSFMELMYRLKREYEELGADAQFVKDFKAAYDKLYEHCRGSSYSVQRVEILDRQIKELQEQYQTAISKQVTAMRESALDQNAEIQRKIQSGEVTINEIEIDLRNGILGGDISSAHWTQFGQIEEGSPAAVYAGLAEEIKHRISQCLEEKRGLEDERGLTVILKRNFDLFVKCLIALPEVNRAGMRMNINGLDVDGSLFVDAEGNVKPGKKGLFNAGHLKVTGEKISDAPDFLDFDKGLYLSFFPKATVKGNTVEYVTNFGVKLISTRIDRGLAGFLGYRKCNEDRTVDFLTHSWQVNGRSIQYQCRERKSGGAKQGCAKQHGTQMKASNEMDVAV